jgi:hypothetical protein
LKHCFGGSELFADFRFSLRVSEPNPGTKWEMTVLTKTMWQSFFPRYFPKAERIFLWSCTTFHQLFLLIRTALKGRYIWSHRWYSGREKAKVPEKRTVPLTVCQGKVLHRINRKLTKVSALEGRRLTAWMTAQLYLNPNVYLLCIYQTSFPISQRTKFVFIKKIHHFILFREIIALYFENHVKYWVDKMQLLNVKACGTYNYH